MPTGEAKLDPRTPVLVATGQLEQRAPDLLSAAEPTVLLAEAARKAAADSGARGLLDQVDTIAVANIMSYPYRDPGALVAAELGISPTRSIATDNGGNYPMTLLNQACIDIRSGGSDTWLIGGAEAFRTRTASQMQGVHLGWTDQGADVPRAEFIANPADLFHQGELARGVVLPSTLYALFENALRAAEGWSIDEHRDRIAALWARFSEVAVDNPNAWVRTPWSAAEIREPSPQNRMIGFPYTKVMNANNAVEQAACIVVTTVDKARALGISTDRWVFPWAGSDANEHWFVSNRWSLAGAPAIGVAGRAAMDLAGVGADDLAYIDIYSCFPSAVQIAANELSLGTDRSLTVTGGLSFAGGPWSNYVTHSIATMVDRLRADSGALGLVTANGGYLTKHAFGVFSTTPPAEPWRHANPQEQVDALPRRELIDEVGGPVAVESAAVMHDRDGRPERAIVAALVADGRRAWGGTSDPDHLARFLTAETSGADGNLGTDGEFTFA